MRLIHTKPLRKVLEAGSPYYDAGHAYVCMSKSAGDAVTTHALSGELYVSKSGWLMLNVPNALVRGAFDALNEPGLELPFNSDGKLNAHISVIRPEELESIGGAETVTERGHHFHYTLGPIKEVVPSGWDDVSKVWFIEVKSTELQDLRKSYGLTPLPKDNKFQFHITIAVRKKHVLRNNEVKKAAVAPSIIASIGSHLTPLPKEIPDADKTDPMEAYVHDDTLVNNIKLNDRLIRKKMRKSRPALLQKLGEDKRRKAVIIRGNPMFNMYPTETENFYNQLQEHLANRGFDVTFDPGEPFTTPPPADLWVGHSRGADRLRFAPKGTIAFDTGPHEHEKARTHAIEQRQLAKTLGFNSLAEMPRELRTEPPVEHYLFTNKMRQALDNAIGYKSNSVLNKANIQNRIAGDEDSSSWAVPAAVGAGLAGLGATALMLKGGEDASEECKTHDPEEHLSMFNYEDFDCDDETLDAIYKYYHEKDASVKEAILGNHKFEASDLYQVPLSLGRKGYDKAKAKVSEVYAKLEKRYGPTIAKLVIGAGLVGAPIPGPGTSFITASPFLAAGELRHLFQGDYKPPTTKSEIAREKEKTKQLKELGAKSAPAAGAGLLAYLLHNSTSSQVPSQVTKFPGQSQAEVIRGRVAPDAPASTIERTGDAYLYATDDRINRSHGIVNNMDELSKLVKTKMPEHQRLGILELFGHGEHGGHYVGNGIGAPDNAFITAPSANKAVAKLNEMPWTTKDPAFITGGCNTGLCDPPKGAKPQNDWLRYIADKTGVNAYGAKAYTFTDTPSGLNTEVQTHGNGILPYIEEGAAIPKAHAWTKYSPNKAPEEIVDSNDKIFSKHTFSSLPNNKLFEALYNIGKPSAVGGALLSPLLADKKKARNVALTTSALAAPMALSEIITRYGEAAAKNTLGQGGGLSTHLASQGKALPYVALAGLPLLSYGAANLLGRWDK